MLVAGDDLWQASWEAAGGVFVDQARIASVTATDHPEPPLALELAIVAAPSPTSSERANVAAVNGAIAAHPAVPPLFVEIAPATSTPHVATSIFLRLSRDIGAPSTTTSATATPTASTASSASPAPTPPATPLRQPHANEASTPETPGTPDRFSPLKTQRLVLPSPRGVFTMPSPTKASGTRRKGGTAEPIALASELQLDAAVLQSLCLRAGDSVTATPVSRPYALDAWAGVAVRPVYHDTRCLRPLPAAVAKRELLAAGVVRDQQMVLLPTEAGQWIPHTCLCTGLPETHGRVTNATRISVLPAAAAAAAVADDDSLEADPKSDALATFSPARCGGVY
jgi:hypothetical protein